MASSSATHSDLHLQTITYQGLLSKDPTQMQTLADALKRDGAVGISGIPNFVDQRAAFFEQAVSFSRLPEEQKQEVQSQGTETKWSYLGFDTGKEQFVDEKGNRHPDMSKSSFYMVYPPIEQNRWPTQVNLKDPCLELSKTMYDVTLQVMKAVGLIGPGKPLGEFEGSFGVGRMLHYTPPTMKDPNPLWCGAHEDHSVMTALLAPRYLQDGECIKAPPGAGLEIKVDGVYRKAIVPQDCLTLQVGDFGQLVSSDNMVATRHRVAKPRGRVDNLSRHTFALFVDPNFRTRVGQTTSVLTQDPRYTEDMTFEDWHLRTLQQNEVKDDSANS